MKYLLPVLLFSLLTACGSSSEFVTLTLRPGTGGSQKAVQSLREQFFSAPHTQMQMNMNLTGPSCLQTNLFAGVKIGGDENDNSNILTFPIKLRTQACTEPTCDGFDAISWLNSASTFEEPIKVQVPRGQNIEVGIIGSFVLPVDFTTTPGDYTSTTFAEPDGICDIRNMAAAPNNATINYSVIGHRKVSATQSATINVRTWIQGSSQPAATPYPIANGTWNPGAFTCPSTAVDGECAYKDFIVLKTVVSSSGHTLIMNEVEYFKGMNRDQPVRQPLSVAQASQNFFIPSVFPIKLTLTTTVLGTVEVKTYNLNAAAKIYPFTGNTTDYFVVQELGSTPL